MTDVMIGGTAVFIGFMAIVLYGGYMFITMMNKSSKELDEMVDDLEKMYDTTVSPTYNKLEVYGVKDGSRLFPYEDIPEETEFRFTIISRKRCTERIIQFDDGTCYPMPVGLQIHGNRIGEYRQVVIRYHSKYVDTISVRQGLGEIKGWFFDHYNHFLSQEGRVVRWSRNKSDISKQKNSFFKEYRGVAEVIAAAEVGIAEAA